MIKYPLRMDLKLIKIFIIVVIFIITGFNIFIYKNTEVIRYIGGQGDIVQTSIYKYSEIYIPVLFSIAFILLFSNDYNGNSFQFLKSLPFNYSNTVILRFIRLFLFVILLYIPTLLNMCYTVNISLKSLMIAPISYTKILVEHIPLLFFLCTLSMMFAIVLRNMYYSFILFMGYYMFEYFSAGSFTGKYTIFINNFKHLPFYQVMINRGLLTVMSILFLVIIFWVTRSKKLVM